MKTFNYIKNKLRKCIGIFSVFILVASFVNAQKSNAELLKVISSAKSDTAVVQAWYKLGKSYRKKMNVDSMQYAYKKGFELASKLKNYSLMAKGNLLMVDYHMLKLNYDEVLKCGVEAVSLSLKANDKASFAKSLGVFQAYYSRIAKKDSLDKYTRLVINAWKDAKDTAQLINSLIWSNHYYRNAGFIDDAVNYTSLAMKFSEQFRDSVLKCEANWCMAVLQRGKGNWEMELKYLNECLRWYNGKNRSLNDIEFLEEKNQAFVKLMLYDSVFNNNNLIIRIVRQKGDSARVFSALLAQAGYYIKKKDGNNAEKEIQKAMNAFHDRSPRYYYGLIMVQIDLYDLLGETGKADMLADELISAVKNNKESNEIDFRTAANISFDRKRYAETKYFLDKCFDFAVSRGIKDDYNYMNWQYAVALSNLGDYKNAYKHYMDYTEIEDSILSVNNSKHIAELENKYQSEKKALQIVGLQNEKSLQESEIKRQNIQKLFFGIAFALVLVLAIVLYRAFRSKQKDNGIITLQKTLVEEKNKEVLDSINYAKKLQDAILPPLNLVKQYLPESFILYKPKDIVAGDFYWMHVLEGKTNGVLICVADCTGHGVPGALVSVVCSNALDRAVKEFNLSEPGKILDKVRELVIETFEASENEVKDGMDISLCLIEQSKITWSGAYNPLWYIERNEFKELIPNKQPIGKTDNPKPFTTHTLELNKGDMIYLITDGYADQFGGPQGKKFKYKNLKEILTGNGTLSAQDQRIKLEHSFESWKGNLEQVDDVTIVGIRI